MWKPVFVIAIVLVAAGTLLGVIRTTARAEHPLDDLTTAERRYVLPDAERRGAKATSCPDDCAGPEWPARESDGLGSAWIVVTSIDPLPGDKARLAYDDTLQGQIELGSTIVDADRSAVDSAIDALDDGLAVVAYVRRDAGVRLLPAVVVFDRSGRFAFVSRTGGYATAAAAHDAAAVGAPSGLDFLRDTLGWEHAPRAG